MGLRSDTAYALGWRHNVKDTLVSRPWYKHERLMRLTQNPQVNSEASIDLSVLSIFVT